MSAGPLWISEADVESLVDPLALVAAVEDGFLSVASGGIREPGSTRMNQLDGDSAYLTLYPAHREMGYATAKILAGRPANARENRPEIDAIVALVDPPTGRIAALVAARALTALRTAAVTASVLRRFTDGRPGRVALVGTGGQARAHARILAAAGLASSFLVASPRGNGDRAKEAADDISARCGIEARSGTIDEAAGCGIVICLSLAGRPLPLGGLRRDAILASIGCFYPHAHEIDPALVARAGFVVSDDPARLRRQWEGSGLLDVDSLAIASVVDLLAGRAAPARDSLKLFLSDGRAFQDNVAASLVYEAALARGLSNHLP